MSKSAGLSLVNGRAKTLKKKKKTTMPHSIFGDSGTRHSDPLVELSYDISE